MREILFRAKIKDTDEWVEGYYAMMGKENLIRHYIVQNCALTGLFSDPEENMYFNDVEIDPETLCQYTGLKDKNGNRIWENDIVSVIFYDEIIYGSIKYGLYNNDLANEVSGSLGFYIDWEDKGNFLRKNIGCWKEELEYAGNIFDNPELLKGE